MRAFNVQNAAAEEAASHWAARLDGAIFETADREALNAWLAQDPVHRSLLSEYCQVSADLERQLPILVASGKVTVPPAPQEATRWKFKWPAFATLAAVALVLITLWIRQPGPMTETIVTGAGHRQSFALADGTRVELNAHSKLVIENGQTERRVRLDQGEAFFMVSKDASRPFIVETAAGWVRVIGTSFNVRTETRSELDVTVMEGTVQVDAKLAGVLSHDPITLTAGGTLSARSSGLAVSHLSRGALDNLLAWREGQIVLEGMPLREALAYFARYHGRQISATPTAASLPVGGRFSLDDVDGFLEAIETILKVRVTRLPTGIVEVSLLPGGA